MIKEGVFSKRWRRRLGTLWWILCLCAPGLAGERGKPAVPEQVKSKPTGHILVIGAGMAGLAAAQTLHSRGFSVTVLEASHRLGGRVHTHRNSGSPVDLGASWIHGPKGNPLTALAEEVGAERHVTDWEDISVFDLDGPLNLFSLAVLYVRFGNIAEKAYKLALNSHEDMSLQSALDQVLEEVRFTEREARLFDFWISVEVKGEVATDPENLGLKGEFAAKTFSGDDVVFPQGYDQLINHLAHDLDIRYNEKVTSVDYHGPQAVVTTENHVHQADYVLCTVSVGVLQSGAMGFSPELPPKKLDAINGIQMGLLNKIILDFPQDGPWPPNQEILGLVSPREGEHLMAVNLFPATGVRRLMVFTSGGFAQRLEEDTDEQMAARATAALKNAYGDDFPDPNSWLTTRWLSNPLTLGSYSYLPPGSTSNHRRALAEPVAARLFFAGEATNAQYPSTVHGAYLSGIREADRITAIAREPKLQKIIPWPSGDDDGNGGL